MKLSKMVGVGLLFSARMAFGLESDSEQPIYIDSDNAVYDEKAQISTYTGNVVATQGTIRIDGDKLVVYLKDGAII